MPEVISIKHLQTFSRTIRAPSDSDQYIWFSLQDSVQNLFRLRMKFH